jgi:hypothetical protein
VINTLDGTTNCDCDDNFFYEETTHACAACHPNCIHCNTNVKHDCIECNEGSYM